MKAMFKFMMPYWKKGLTPVIFLFISTLITFVFPMFPRWAIDEIVPKKNYWGLLILAVVFFVLIIAQRLFSYLNEITFFSFQKNTILDIQRELLERVFSSPMEFFDKNHSGYLLGRIRGDVTGLCYIFSEGLVMFAMDIVKFSGTIVILLIINTKLTLITLIVVPFLFIKIYLSRNEIKTTNEKIIEENALLEKEVSDTFQGIEVLKSFSREDEGKKRVEKALEGYQQIEIKRNKTVSQYRNLIDLIVHLGEVLLLYFGIREVILGHLTIGGYIAFSGYMIYVYWPIQNLSSSLIFIDYAKRSFSRIKQLYDLLPEDSGTVNLTTVEKIEARGLCFSYDGQNNVVDNINFEFSKGEKVLLKGDSGSGKSTIIKLLLGLYAPQSGSILFNGIEARKIDKKKLREKIGYISQNIFLFNKSLRENILLGHTDIDDSRLRGILSQCRLKSGGEGGAAGSNRFDLDTQISEKGANFSGGEKQRIALARALVKEPQIVILDEATANIDLETEAEIEKMIFDLFADKIIIKISHHPQDESGWKVFRLSVSGQT